MTPDEELRALHLKRALRMAANAVAMLEMYVGDARRAIDRGDGSSGVARNMGAAVADLAAASAQIELLTKDFK